MHSIWAVAINTVKQALRIKIAIVFTILLVILLPLMGFSTTGDGTMKGKLQTFVSYGLSLTSLLLCLLTIIISAYSLTSDIEQKQIYTVITKPIRRFQLLFGKLLGVILLDVVLLVLFSVIIYVIAICIPKFSHLTQNELSQLNNEFFTARAGLTPIDVDVTSEVRDTYNKLERTGQLPPEVLTSKNAREDYLAALTRQIKSSKRAATVGQELVWEFYNIKPFEPNQSLFIRFKYDVAVNPPDLQVYGAWLVGDYRQLKYGTKIETPVYTLERKDLIRTFQEIEVPADAVAKDGYLSVVFLNTPFNDTVVIFPPADGLEVLYKADNFTANFTRAVLLILSRLIFLASLGVLASTCLSFPVAILLCLSVFSVATISGFVIESFNYLSENISVVYFYTAKPLMQLLPQFDKYNPTKYLVSAQLLSWSLLAKVAGSMICIKAVLLILLALWIFKRREIAKITV